MATATPGQGIDRSDFDAAFAGERRRLYAIALSILRDPIEAQDATQETAILAWRSWFQRQDIAKTGAWLDSICVRDCLRRRRSLVRRLFLTDVEKHRAATASHLRADGRFIDLDRCYATLSRQQRAVVSLHYHHGYSLSEAADLMGCSAGSAAQHLSRALAKLRKELADDE